MRVAILVILICQVPISAYPQRNVSWMLSVNDSSWLSELSIPGTHDSGARRDSFPQHEASQCQKLAISEQLQIGARFLDVRCRRIGGKFEVFHGSIDQGVSFDEV